ncbi:MAG: ABC transporter permease [Candidatus Marinimicrobia bacterium]|nr:ABC transporter permease [Candidatus Neomarinimicrobiota bacterium]
MLAWLIKLKENIMIAVKALKQHKMRSVLTTLGIIIGVLTVVSVASIISGLNKGFKDKLSFLGSNTLYIQKYPWMTHGEWYKYRNRPDLTMNNYEYLRDHTNSEQVVIAPSVSSHREVKFDGNSLTDVPINGVTKESEIVSNMVIDEGRFFTNLEIDRRKNRVVIGYAIKEKLFENKDPIGIRIRIDGNSFYVIGVMEKKGKFLGNNFDINAYIPVGSFFKNFGYHRSISIEAKVMDAANLKPVKEKLRYLMRFARGLKPGVEDNFSINQQETIQQQYDSLTSGLYTAAIGIGTLALLVGGIGIMNIMLVSVTERQKEIGIRKSIGATNRIISFQFLVESIIICSLGGMIALLLSYFVAIGIQAVTPFPASIPLWSIFMGLGFSWFVGIFFGLYPAHQAAKLDPIESLHYE